MNAAVEEALRSPFHAQSGNNARFSLGATAHHPVAPLQEARDTSVPARQHSGASVFLPTLTATLLADIVALATLFGGSGAQAALGMTGAAVVPGLVAGAITKRYTRGLLGSLLGAGGATLLLVAFNMDKPLPLALAPVVHAVMTTAFAVHGSGD